MQMCAWIRAKLHLKTWKVYACVVTGGTAEESNQNQWSHSGELNEATSLCLVLCVSVFVTMQTAKTPLTRTNGKNCVCLFISTTAGQEWSLCACVCGRLMISWVNSSARPLPLQLLLFDCTFRSQLFALINFTFSFSAWWILSSLRFYCYWFFLFLLFHPDARLL